MSIYDSENDRFADTDILIRDDKKGGNGFLIADKCIVFGYPLLSVALGVFLFSGTLKLSVIIAVIGYLVYVGGLLLLYRKSHREKSAATALWAVRTVGLSFLLLAFAVPLISMNFKREKSMYEVKRLIYIAGVESEAQEILPECLPTESKDYYFLTEGKSERRENLPFTCLVLRTDFENLKKVAEKVSVNNNNFFTSDRGIYHTEIIGERVPKNLPIYVFDQIRNKAKIKDDLKNAVLYRGVLINYDTGLLVIWK